MGFFQRHRHEDYLIRRAYQLLLGREPENDIVVRAKRGLSVEELRKEFSESYEFRTRNRNTLTPRIHREVIKLASPGILDSYLANTISQWRSLGESEPFWSVLSSDDYRGELSLPEKERFYLSGKKVVDDFKYLLDCRSIALSKESKVLELGCGVGRITKALASDFRNVTAVDISPGNLRIAKMELSSLPNVDFVLADALTSLERIPIDFDVFLSVITLQHNPPEIQRIFLKEMLSKLKKKGSVAYFQTVTHITERGNKSALGGSQEMTFDTYAFPMHQILEVINKSGFKIFELFRDDWNQDPDYHSYSFYLKN
jgi:SAM-dependent methyltransferase